MLRYHNLKNYLKAVIADNKIEVNQLNNKFMYSNIYNLRQNLSLKLLFAINNIKSTTMAVNHTAISILIYYSKNRLIFFNNQKISLIFIL